MADSWRQEALAARPAKQFLFLCVQNSARSQLAEAVARHVAPADRRIFSAGSRPAQLRPEVPRVLAEVGISSEGLRAKGLDELDLSEVDAVITLCAEEVCPLFPRPVLTLHWALPDPAAVSGEGRLGAFRAARDELLRRLHVIFDESPA